MDDINIGSDIKILVNASVGNLTLDSVDDFTCEVNVGGVISRIPKSGMVRLADTTGFLGYLACIRANKTHKGDVQVKIIAKVSDDNYKEADGNGYRIEVGKCELGNKVV